MAQRGSASCQKNVKQKSNDCAAAHDDSILNNICTTVFETFSTPERERVAGGEGRPAVIETAVPVEGQRLHQVHNVVFLCAQNPNMQLRERGIRE